MREIKFRAWDKVCKSFHEGDLIRDYVIGEFIDNPEYEVTQFTGLKDRSGTKIYEGDILKRKFEIGHTIYDPVTFGVVDYEITDSGHFVGVAHYRPSEGFVLAKVRKYNGEGEFVEKKSAVKIYPRYAEIIGNRFDNPELLLEVTN